MFLSVNEGVAQWEKDHFLSQITQAFSLSALLTHSHSPNQTKGPVIRVRLPVTHTLLRFLIWLEVLGTQNQIFA